MSYDNNSLLGYITLTEVVGGSIIRPIKFVYEVFMYLIGVWVYLKE